MNDQDLPVELRDALDADEEARGAWEEATDDVQRLYINYVRKPWSRRMRRVLAADTAAWATAGELTTHIQRPSIGDAAVAVGGEGCLGALLRFGL